MPLPVLDETDLGRVVGGFPVANLGGFGRPLHQEHIERSEDGIGRVFSPTRPQDYTLHTEGLNGEPASPGMEHAI